jgi:hypothetical protein
MEFEPVILPMGWRVIKVATVDRDPEVKYLPDGQAVANFSTANPPGRLEYANVSGPIWSVNVNERVSTEVSAREARGDLREVPRQGTGNLHPGAVGEA